MINNENTVLTPIEVAGELRCSLRLVYRQLRAGIIPHVKVGDKYLIPCAAFESWLLDCHPGSVGTK